ARQLEHGVIERVEARESDELEAETHRRELALELRDGRIVELPLPIEGWRAVVGEQLAGKLRMDPLGELARFLEIGLGGLAPEQISIQRIGAAARDRRGHAGLHREEAFAGPSPGAVDEGPVALID